MAGASLLRNTVPVKVLAVERFHLFIRDQWFFIRVEWEEKKVQFDLRIGHVLIFVFLKK